MMEKTTEKRKRGFAAMDPEKQKEIARKGGRAAHEKRGAGLQRRGGGQRQQGQAKGGVERFHAMCSPSNWVSMASHRQCTASS